MKVEKTNVMRILDSKKLTYVVHEYPHKEGICVEGVEVSKLLNQNPSQVYKTLVTQGTSKQYFVFMVPVGMELDLKKASKAVMEKAVELIPAKNLFPITGYVRGGCSPIGMKRNFKVVIDSSAQFQETIFFSAGKIGKQIE